MKFQRFASLVSMKPKKYFTLWDSDFVLLVFPEKVSKLLSYQENLYYFKHLDLSGAENEKSATSSSSSSEKPVMAMPLTIGFFSFCNFCISH